MVSQQAEKRDYDRDLIKIRVWGVGGKLGRMIGQLFPRVRFDARLNQTNATEKKYAVE